MRYKNQVLLIYHHPLHKSAPTVMEHVSAFAHSQFKTWWVNTEVGFPPDLHDMQFDIIVLHYSLFGIWPYKLDERFTRYLENNKTSFKIAFFQDEHHYCQHRFDFLNRFHIDCVYTCLELPEVEKVYKLYTKVPLFYHTIPGYVSNALVKLGIERTKPDHLRQVDIGYRGRRLLYYMGKASQEKHEIGIKFREHVAGSSSINMVLDIETNESKRIYGDNWFDFLTGCRGTLGVETGVSIFDLHDEVRLKYEELKADHPDMTFRDFERLAADLLAKYEGNVYYRTVGPRHFEAAAFKICQVNYEGIYSGILEPMVHYIPLKKDFSNFNEAVDMFKDKELRRQICENAWQDLIASGLYSYETFIDEFDRDLVQSGFTHRGATPGWDYVTTPVVKPAMLPSVSEKGIALLMNSEKQLAEGQLLAACESTVSALEILEAEPQLLAELNGIEKQMEVENIPMPDTLKTKIDHIKKTAAVGDKPIIRNLSKKYPSSAVDSYWNDFTVYAKFFETPGESEANLKWRSELYPFFMDFMELYGHHDNEIILDYGCGPGNDVTGFALYTDAKQIIGMDISEKALRYAQHRLALHDIPPSRIKLIKISDSETRIPLDDHSIDHLVCGGVIHHTSEPGAVLKELVRVLKPGAKANVMVYNLDSIYYHIEVAYIIRLVNRTYPGLSMEEVFTRSTDGKNCPISRCFAAPQFIEHCISSGFSHAQFMGGYFYRHELEWLKQYRQQALDDPRLEEEHKQFLREIEYDADGNPLYKGKLAGIGGVYRLRK